MKSEANALDPYIWILSKGQQGATPQVADSRLTTAECLELRRESRVQSHPETF